MAATLRIGIVAGEASGDILGSNLIKAIKLKFPDAQFEGIGGPLMLEQGFESHFPMERLSVMGLIEPIPRLPELLSIRKSIIKYFTANPPDLFLGIDSPDFNLNIELALRQKNILTVHYVSPSVWAWRQGRIAKIAKAVDHMLTLFPFEADFYKDHKVPVSFVGHPLADQFPCDLDSKASAKRLAREALGFSSKDCLVALLPGSRGGEVKHLGPAFIETARNCLAQRPDLKFIIPAANEQRKRQLLQILGDIGAGGADLPITLLDGQSQTVMAAADVVLMASGTTTLEAMLLGKPMVVAYKMSAISYFIISRLVKSPYISLPNLLAGEKLVPEILQGEVTAQRLAPLLIEQLENSDMCEKLSARFTTIHESIRQNASERAATVLLNLIKDKAAASALA